MLPIIPLVGRLRQEDRKYQASLDNIMRLISLTHVYTCKTPPRLDYSEDSMWVQEAVTWHALFELGRGLPQGLVRSSATKGRKLAT